MAHVAELFVALTFFTALGCGLIGGVFFAFSAFLMKALARLPASSGIAAMQSINVAVINPVFLTAFLGTAAACCLLTVATGLNVLLTGFVWSTPQALVVVGSVLYLLGTLGVTIAFNLPWNYRLDLIDPARADGAEIWASYLRRWTAWNHVRTLASFAAAAAFILALRR